MKYADFFSHTVPFPFLSLSLIGGREFITFFLPGFGQKKKMGGGEISTF